MKKISGPGEPFAKISSLGINGKNAPYVDGQWEECPPYNGVSPFHPYGQLKKIIGVMMAPSNGMSFSHS